ncbi:GIY-YIG nuclease family protein [Candidatus Babeliales bacterium]|nr:GIY-YIG nuclease family protein [Candidatus Babeliales bacterium]
MYYVYLLRSELYPEMIYTGYTTNLKQRLAEHNYGKSIHTAKYKPWQLELCLAFRIEAKAIAFE